MRYAPKQHEIEVKPTQIPLIRDPQVLEAARQIYRTYFSFRSKVTKRPLGVAIDLETQRGQLLFTARPILLPGEHFVPLNQLEMDSR
jgi:hypothetical protein